MTVETLIGILKEFPQDVEVLISIKGVEVEPTQIVWQGSEPVRVIIDDYPTGF